AAAFEGACYPRPAQAHQSAVFYRGRLRGVLNVRPLGDAVEADLDTVPRAAGFHDRQAAFAVHDEGGRPGALEGVAELAAGGADVVGLVRDADVVVEGPLDNVGGHPRAVVKNPQAVVPDRDGDLGRHAGLLAGVQGVVDQLLEDADRPEAA